MKRRNAMLLGLAFLLMVAGYVAWCWRPFYLRTPVRPCLPDQQLALFEQWRVEHPDWDRSPFDGRMAVRMLIRPWYDYRGMVTANAIYNNGERMICQIDHTPTRRVAILKLVNVDGKWTREDAAAKGARKP